MDDIYPLLIYNTHNGIIVFRKNPIMKKPIIVFILVLFASVVMSSLIVEPPVWLVASVYLTSIFMFVDFMVTANNLKLDVILNSEFHKAVRDSVRASIRKNAFSFLLLSIFWFCGVFFVGSIPIFVEIVCFNFEWFIFLYGWFYLTYTLVNRNLLTKLHIDILCKIKQ